MKYNPLNTIKDIGRCAALWVPLMAMAALSSCSSDDNIVVPTRDNPLDSRLRFNVSVDDGWKETRGERIEQELEQSFGLFAYTYGKNDAWNSTTLYPDWMCDQEVTMVPEGWATTSLVTLPAGGTKIQFFAYYPFRDPEMAEEESQFLTSRPMYDTESDDASKRTAGNPRFGFTTEPIADDQTDFLVGVSKEYQVPTANANAFFETPVKLRFRHMLAGVIFKVGEEFTEPMTITSISISNVKLDGNLTVAPPTSDDYSTAEYTWSDVSRHQTVSVTTNFDVKKPSMDDPNTDVGKIINAGEQVMFLIPQKLSDESERDGENNAIKSKISVRVNDNITLEKELNETELKRGKITVFTISVTSMAKLSLKTQIIDWNSDAENTFGGSAQEGNAIIPHTAIDDWVDYEDTEGSFTKTMQQPELEEGD